MRVGDTLETGIWLTGRETEEQRQKFEADCRRWVEELEAQHNVVCGPVRFFEKLPGEDRVPPVPDHLHGPNVRLLVVEADIVAEGRIAPPRRFVDDLERRDLLRLRAITRRAYARHNPGAGPLTDAQCDEIIERLGPTSAAKVVAASVDSGTVH